MTEQRDQLHALVCGGSIGGLMAAHALLSAGCRVTVLERASSVSSAGAGLGLDPHTEAVMESLGLKQELHDHSLPMPIEVNRNVKNQQASVLTRDERYNNRSTHWSDIHQMLLKALPDRSIMHFAHTVTSFDQDSSGVTVAATKKGEDATEQELSFQGDLLVAADGSMSGTRSKLTGDDSRRYSGYCAWRGLLKIPDDPKVAERVQQAYADMGKALYFDIAKDTHAVVYRLPQDRLNWLWYINQPEPELQGHSVTVKADEATVAAMKQEASSLWPPALAALMQATKQPFINAIFDREPLEQFVYGRVVLLGEAAHPTTPHGLRSTNMAIGDAAALGQAIKAHPGDLERALSSYEEERIPITTQEVLFSRWLGQLKQGMLNDGDSFQWQADDTVLKQVPQHEMRSYDPARHRLAQT